MDFIAGIDGGGTKTTVLCRTLDGKELDRRQFGAFNLNGIGEDAFRVLLDEMASFLCSLGTCRALCIGAAGISNRTMSEMVSEAVTKAGISKWSLVGDHEIAMCGALDGGSGICLIAGTGSICFGRAEDGRLERAGGWGHLIGDEGSGYRLGHDVLAAVAKEMDGYGEKTILTSLLQEKMGLKTRSDIISYVYSHDKSAVGAISPLVDDAVLCGDAVALAIVKDNADALVRLVCAVSKKLGFTKTQVALLGGLLSHTTCMREVFVSLLRQADPAKICIDPIHDAATGAVMMAGRLLNG